MALHVFLLVVCILFTLALLWHLDWFHLRSSSSPGGAKRSMFRRLLKPRTPDDCPACRLASTPSSGEGPAPAPVRPWREVKSGRGAPKRVNTQGYACPNQISARRDTPLYRLKTPSQQVAVVLSALAERLDPSAAERVFGFRQATITRWLARAGLHAQTLHERFLSHLQLPHLQLDELRTRLRSAT